MTQYIEAFHWPATIERWLSTTVSETPLLHVCSGTSKWGDIRVDLEMPADVQADWKGPWPFTDDQFGAVFADPPWDGSYKREVASFMREALRVAPVAYLMSPWVYGAAWAKLDRVWVRRMPGVNNAILVSRYVRG